jgi:hypothetical protein
MHCHLLRDDDRARQKAGRPPFRVEPNDRETPGPGDAVDPTGDTVPQDPTL